MTNKKRLSDLSVFDCTDEFEALKGYLGSLGIAEQIKPTRRKHQTEDPSKQVNSLTNGVPPSAELLDELIGLTGFLWWHPLSVANAEPGTVYALLKQILDPFGFVIEPRKETRRNHRRPVRGTAIITVDKEWANQGKIPFGGSDWVASKSTSNSNGTWELNSSHEGISHKNGHKNGHKAEYKDWKKLDNERAILYVIKGSDPTSVIFLCVSSTRDTFAALRLFTSEQIIKELQHYAAKMHSFTSVYYLTKEELSWIKPFEQVSANNMVAAMLNN